MRIYIGKSDLIRFKKTSPLSTTWISPEAGVAGGDMAVADVADDDDSSTTSVGLSSSGLLTGVGLPHRHHAHSVFRGLATGGFRSFGAVSGIGCWDDD